MENIDKDDKNQELSYSQGVELITKLWESSQIKKLGKRLKTKSEDSGKTWYLVTLGTGYVKDLGDKADEDAKDEYEIALTHTDIDNKVKEYKEKI